MRTFSIILVLATLNTFAHEEFVIEESLPKQQPIPASIIENLKSQISSENNSCSGNNFADALEATKVQLKPDTTTILIKPKSWCLCGTYYCPAWIYKIEANHAQPLWRTQGTSEI